MSRVVNVNGTSYTLPLQSDDAPWGSDLSDLIQALVDVANSVVGTGDILSTTFSLSNNVSSPQNITGLVFDTGVVRSAIISYSIYRTTSSDELSECGQMMITYLSTSNSWILAQYDAGSSGVTFSITNAGQLQYVSSNMSGTGYSGVLKFKASAFTQ